MPRKPKQPLWKRTLILVTAFLLFVVSVFLVIAFLSFNPFDPSFNVASDAVVKNYSGALGAYISGPLLSLFGVGVYSLVICTLAWSWLFFKEKKVKNLWLRVSSLFIMLPACASLASLLDAMDIPVDWPSDSYGGFIGSFTNNNLVPYLTILGFAVVAFILSIITLILASGIKPGQWKSIVVKLKLALTKIYSFITLIMKPFFWIYRIFYKLFNKKNKGKTSSSKSVIRKKTAHTINKKNSTNKAKPSKKQTQQSLDLVMKDEYQIPSLSLLKLPARRSKSNLSETALTQNAAILEKILEDFGIYGEIVEVSPGPVVTLYSLEPSPGTKSSRVIGLADDIARSMSAVSARISVIPGQNAIGIELPNTNRETVYLKEVLDHDVYKKTKAGLPLTLGKDISGEPIIADLAKMPHLLVAGTTGSGKSVGINAMILSLLYKYTPEECRFIMVDPKMLELSIYQDIPHLLTPVVTEPKKAVVALKWAVKEMEDRYRLMSNLSVRNVSGYNEKIAAAKKKGVELTRTVQTGYDPDTGKPIFEDVALDMTLLPYLVVIVDEMADLMLVAGKEIEVSVQRLAQMARAAGIHLILATQRPSVDVITGIIKANFPTRISFQVTSKIDSRTILGEQGAEQLLGQGDMLYMHGGSKITRVHGPFVDDSEVDRVVKFLRSQGKPDYVESVTSDEEDSSGGTDAAFGMGAGNSSDDLYDKAVAIVIKERKASTSYIQRSLKIGYNRAANIVEEMEKQGILSEPGHNGKRQILIGED